MLEIDCSPGRLQGTWADADRRVRVWRGIPYAAPPVGPLRWCPPQPAPGWAGVRVAHHFGNDFPQAPSAASRAPGQSEDCLSLNIWSPAEAAAGSLPVMVWLHGGGFVAGSGADVRCEGTRLGQRGAVVVTFNYRSGLFGFFAHPQLSERSESGTSGNYGLLDQLAALQWVQANIAAFGGDPARVTVFGVSAGSACIAMLLTLPRAQGLFHRAILHSPGTGRPLATLADAERTGLKAGADIDALRALPAAQVLALTSTLSPAVRGLTTPRVLRPIRDGWLVPQDERDAFVAGRLHRMPLIVGTNLDEGSFLTRTWPIATRADHERLLAENFGRDLAGAHRHYGAADDSQARPAVARAFGDTQFNYGARLLLRSMTATGQPCWRYLFTRQRPGRHEGPHHGDEVGYAFGHLAPGRGSEPEPFDEADTRLSEAMMDYWVTFATMGTPAAAGRPTWPVFDASEPHLELGDTITPGADTRQAALDFLEGYFRSASS